MHRLRILAIGATLTIVTLNVLARGFASQVAPPPSPDLPLDVKTISSSQTSDGRRVLQVRYTNISTNPIRSLCIKVRVF